MSAWTRSAREVLARPWIDAAVAAVFLLVIEWELWRLPHGSPDAASRAGGLLVGLAISVPLVWRRRAPIASSVVVLAATAAGQALFHARAGQGPLFAFLAFLLVCFSLAAYARALDRVSGASLVLAVTAVGVTQAVFGEFDVGMWVAGALFAGLGYLYRGRLLQVSQLEGETASLRQDRNAAARQAVAEERTRIARELHDVVAHNVSLMTVQAGAARHTLDPNDTEMGEVLESIQHTGRQALVELRRLLGILRQPIDQPDLAPIPSLTQIDGLIAQFREVGLEACLRVEGGPVVLPPGVDLAAYRIVQEALTNSLKHSGSPCAEVNVRYGRADIEVEVLDNGGPITNVEGGTGHGLIGMRERAALYGGTLTAGPRTGGGFAVVARLPFDGSVR